MQFKNPKNGYIENRSVPWLWSLLFGGFYYIACGLVAPFIIWISLVAVLYAAFGMPATMFVPIISIIYAALAPSQVRASYLHKGWVEVNGDLPELPQSIQIEKNIGAEKIKSCPFCAEDIKFEAIKCKHCGTILDSMTRPDVHE